MTSAEKFQRQLLNECRPAFSGKPMAGAIEAAFLATPRHRFVKRYRLPLSKEWQEVDDANLEQHLSTLYRDRPLFLFGEDDESAPSTISQPSLVLIMLNMLQLERGHRVFELGAGSGWNAALMGHMVGAEGRVHSVEINPEVARRAAQTMESLSIQNVRVVESDGGDGYEAGAPYDRAVFTAGSFDLPRAFYEQVKEAGLLLIVIKNKGGGDNLFLLRKTENHFESVDSLPCGFVPMTGRYRMEDLDAVCLEDQPEWAGLKDEEVSRIPFWWGGKGQGFGWRTMPIRSYLGITEPLFESFKRKGNDSAAKEEDFFGLWDRKQHSLVIAKDDLLIGYGSVEARDRLRADLLRWVELGMPAAASFKLRVYPIDAPLAGGSNQWIVKRRQSQFLWSLDC